MLLVLAGGLGSPAAAGARALIAGPGAIHATPSEADYTSATYAPGTGTLSLRFDDFPYKDFSFVFPELVKRGLVAGFAVMGKQAAGDDIARLKAMSAAGMEIMCHSMTHGDDPTTAAEFTFETTDAVAAMRASGLPVVSFVAPGSWNSALLIKDRGFWGSPQDLELRAHFAAYESYIPGPYTGYLSLFDTPFAPDLRYGRTHSTPRVFEGVWNNSAIRAQVDAVDGQARGIELAFHSANIGEAGLSYADFLAGLDYIAARVAAGTLTVLTPTQQVYARVAVPTATVTSPAAGVRWPAGSLQSVSWTMSPTAQDGEFNVCLVSASGATRYADKRVLPVPGRTSYTTTLAATAPAAAGYRVHVDWRPTAGSGGWTSRASSAPFVVSTLAVTAPTAGTRWTAGSRRTVSWTISPAVSTGEFRIWLMNAAGTTRFMTRQALPVAGATVYGTRLRIRVPAPGAYSVHMCWRPTEGAGKWAEAARSAPFKVTRAAAD